MSAADASKQCLPASLAFQSSYCPPKIGIILLQLVDHFIGSNYRMTSAEVAAITGLAPVPHERRAMRGRKTIAGGRRSMRHVLFQAFAAACQNPVLNPVAKRLEERGKPDKLVIIAIARKLVTNAHAIVKTGIQWKLLPRK